MSPHYRPLAIFFALLIITVGWLIANMGDAHADQIEPASRTVERVEVTYAEPIPTPAHKTRAYFELNDGSAWVYVNYLRCAGANKVPNRACQTVFWYAR